MENKIYDLMEKMYVELQEVKAEVKQNSNHILRLENKMDEKFAALFDGRQGTNEKLDEINDKVDGISSDVSSIELITSKNWHDVAVLKKAK